ncbi:antitoxin Xre/MbcA/ParS toxin-binding domain-containing protein [Roseomonas sp. GCM10028921]
MAHDVVVEIPVDRATAEILRDPQCCALIGELAVRLTRTWDGVDPLSGYLTGEILLRHGTGRAVTGLTAGQAASLTGQLGNMTDEEVMAPATVIVTVADILAQADRVMGEPGARRWLFSPIPALGRKRPIDLLATNEGALQVSTLIGQIEHGVYT